MATSSVDFMPSFSAWKLLINNGRINGVLAVGSNGVQREIEAGLVVGADGRQSRIAELAKFDPKVKPRLNLLSLGGGVCQPFGRLEGPAAPDVPVSVEAKRRVANERQTGSKYLSDQIRIFHYTHHRTDAPSNGLGKAERPSRFKSTCRRR